MIGDLDNLLGAEDAQGNLVGRMAERTTWLEVIELVVVVGWVSGHANIWATIADSTTGEDGWNDELLLDGELDLLELVTEAGALILLHDSIVVSLWLVVEDAQECVHERVELSVGVTGVVHVGKGL